MDGGERRPVIDALTGVRALAAGVVLLFHLRTPLLELAPVTAKIDPWLVCGYLGVDVFFVLSGFIISHNYAERLARLRWSTWRGFMVARFARLYPVHLVTLLLAAGLVLLSGAGLTSLAAVGGGGPGYSGYSPAGFVGNLAMLQGFPGVGMWNGPSWSITCEAAAYLVFPLVAGLVARCGPRAALLGFAVAGTVLVLVVNEMTRMSTFPWFGFLWVRLATEFAMGCLLWAAWRRVSCRSRLGDVVAVTGVVAGLGLLRFGQSAGLGWVSVSCFAVAVAAVAASAGPVRAVLASRPVEWLGRVSYSLYLVHIPVLIPLFLLVPYQAHTGAGWPVRLGVIALYLLAPLAAAAVLHHLVEEPARRWIRRRAGGRPPAPADDPSIAELTPGREAVRTAQT